MLVDVLFQVATPVHALPYFVTKFYGYVTGSYTMFSIYTHMRLVYDINGTTKQFHSYTIIYSSVKMRCVMPIFFIKSR